jgi:glyoxylase-like metal-dependent hydrolase (beta-lactamase superfamily II)
MFVEYSVISIGTLSHNLLWGESAAVRTSHATTTLVRTDKRTILVDPSLPAQILSARFQERTGKTLDAVTDVFCTTLRPVHRRAIEAMPKAAWWVFESELEAHREQLEKTLDSAERLDAGEVDALKADLGLLERFRPAPEHFDEQAHLYPMVGASPGSAGLLLTPHTETVIVAGDAAVTAEHIRRGQVWEGCFDAESAMHSMEDLLEIADVIIPGHDNVLLSPTRWL